MASSVNQGSTGNQYIDGLLSGVRWGSSFTYSFPQNTGQYQAGYTAELTNNFQAVTFQQREATRAILSGDTFSNTANVVTATSVNSFIGFSVSEAGGLGNGLSGAGDIRLGESTLANPTAYAYYPNNNANGNGGDVWFGTQYAGTTNDYRNPVAGGYAYHTHIHELGHAMGLKHAQEAGGPANVAMPSSRDAIEWTVMSYRSYVGGPSAGGYTYGQWDAPQTFMMYDIQALQTMYGAYYGSLSNNTNSVYTWNPLTGAMSINGASQGTPGGNRVFLTIWDGGGVDTYDMSNYTNDVRISLSPGGSSITSETQRANLGNSQKATGNVYNALLFNGDLRSIIENGTGGSGNDTITGNQVANVLTGNAGNDTLKGGGGADSLNGGLGNDIIFVDAQDTGTGGAGNDTYYIEAGSTLVEAAGGGTDKVFASISYTLGANLEDLDLEGSNPINGAGNALNNVIDGNGANNTLRGFAGNDTLRGASGNDTLIGDDGNDVLAGGPGNDVMNGGLGNDLYYFSTGDIMADAGGIDTVISDVTHVLGAPFENLYLTGAAVIHATGNASNNVLSGNTAGNLLTGLGGNDSMVGGAGNDFLVGGLGRDTYNGGAGADRYDFNTSAETVVGALRDVIANFSHAEGDRIDLANIDANIGLGGDQAFAFIGGGAFTGAGQLRYAGGILYGNTGGTLAADFEIQITGAPALVVGDFYL